MHTIFLPGFSAYVCFLSLEYLSSSSGLNIMSGPLGAFSEPPLPLPPAHAVQHAPPVCSCAPHTYLTGLRACCLNSSDEGKGCDCPVPASAARGTAGTGVLQLSALFSTSRYKGQLLPLNLRSSVCSRSWLSSQVWGGHSGGPALRFPGQLQVSQDSGQ